MPCQFYSNSLSIFPHGVTKSYANKYFKRKNPHDDGMSAAVLRLTTQKRNITTLFTLAEDIRERFQLSITHSHCN